MAGMIELARIKLFARRRAVELALFAGTLVLFIGAYARYFVGGQSFEFCHYAEIASNLLSGRGYSTRMFYPSSLAYLHEAGVAVRDAGPVFERFPLFAAWSALWLAVGRGDFGMALGNGVAHALVVALIYGLGRRVFSRVAALAAAILFAANPVMLAGFDLYGHPDVLFIVIFGTLASAYWWALRDETVGPGRFAALGLLGGAAFLARYSFTLWLPVFGVAPFVARRRGAAPLAGAFVGAFALVWLPWVLFEAREIGSYSPAFGLWNLAEGTVVPSLPWMEYRTFSFFEFFNPGVLAHAAEKAISQFNAFAEDVPTLWRLLFLSLFAAAGMATAVGPTASLAGWIALLFGWQASVMASLRYESLGRFLGGRYYVWFAPFLLLFATDFLVRKAVGSRAWRLGCIGVALLTAQFWVADFVMIPHEIDHASKRPVGEWPELDYLKQSTPDGTWILTNIPTQVAWYTRRHAINIPNQPTDMESILRDWPVDYLLISKSRIGELSNYPAWRALLFGGPEGSRDRALAAMGFEMEQAFQEAILYKRRRKS